MKNRAMFALILTALIAPGAHAATTVSCPTNGGGDQVSRGFYVTNYAGLTLDTVTLTYYPGSGTGNYTVSLTPRLTSFSGTVVGTTQTATINISGGSATAVFNFGNAPVPAGSTLTFTQVLVSGPVASPVLFFDYGAGPLGDIGANTCPNVFETESTSAPLDSQRRASVGVTITGAVGTPPVDTVSAPALSRYALALLTGLLVFFGFAIARARRH